MGAASQTAPPPEAVASQFTEVYYGVAARQPNRLAELYGDDSQLSHIAGSVLTGTADIAAAALSLPLANKARAIIRSVDSMHTGAGGYVLLVTGILEGEPFAQTFVLESAGDKDSKGHFYCRNDVFRFISHVPTPKAVGLVGTNLDKRLCGEEQMASKSLARKSDESESFDSHVARDDTKPSRAGNADPVGNVSDIENFNLNEGGTQVGPEGEQNVEEDDEGEDEVEDGESDGSDYLEEAVDRDGIVVESLVDQSETLADQDAVSSLHAINSVSANETQGENTANIAGNSVSSSEIGEGDITESNKTRLESTSTVSPKNLDLKIEPSQEAIDSSAKPNTRKSWASIVLSSTSTIECTSPTLSAIAHPKEISPSLNAVDAAGRKLDVVAAQSKSAASVKQSMSNAPTDASSTAISMNAAHHRSSGASSLSTGQGGWNSVDSKRYGGYHQNKESSGFKILSSNGHADDSHGNSQNSHHNNYYSKQNSSTRVFGPSAVIQLSSLPADRTKDWRSLQSDLLSEFSGYGHEVRNVEVKNHKGLAFVEYEHSEGVRAAVAAWADGPRENGPFRGIPLSVTEKRFRRYFPGGGNDRGGIYSGRGSIRGSGRGGGGRGRGRGTSIGNGSSVGSGPPSSGGNTSAAASS